MRFVGKVALVTGSTKGIGAQIARRFAAEGASVVVTGRSKDAGDQVVEEILASGGTAHFVAADISKPDEVDQLIRETVAKFGRLDVLVNNAAPVMDLNIESHLASESLDSFESIVRVGLFGPVYAAKAALPELLKAGRSAIVNISSIAGLQTANGLPAYAVSKGGLQALTRQLAGDYGPQGLRANCIITGAIYHPGGTAEVVITHPDTRKALEDMLLTKDCEIGTPDDIAEATLFLASDGARYINGVELPVDGGLMCRGALPDTARILKEAAMRDANVSDSAVAATAQQ